MLRIVALLAAVAGLALPGSAAAGESSLAADAKAFGARESIRSVDISPSGTQLLFIVAGPGRLSALRSIDIATKQAKTLLATSGDPEDLYWCAFGSDTQLVCKYGGLAAMERMIVGFSRLVTVSANGGKPQELGQRESYYNLVLRQYDGDILDWLPNAPGSVLMARNYIPERSRPGSNIKDTREGLGVDRIDLSTLKSTVLESPQREASSFMTDGLGNVRLMEVGVATGEERELTGVWRYKFRTRGSKDWQPFVEYRSSDHSGAYPLAIEADSDSAFVTKKLDGRAALYRVKLDGGGAISLVAANKDVDIDDVVRVGHGQRVIGYTYAADNRKVVYFDPEFTKLAASLSKALPNHPVVDFEGASADGSKLLIFAGSDTDPGTYYLLDKHTRHLDEIAPVRPELAGHKLAPVQPLRVPAPGGVQIPGYLTLPLGRNGRSLPAIVLPHGGPSARDEGGFDWLAQFLAARGYAVVQPNYRGSAGYGDQWEGANGFKDWETAIGDISASARYLVAQGIADPKRLAILGWSYGGYAALQSAAVDPDLYRAAVAIAPVTDLSLLKSQAEHFTNRRLINELVGSGAHIIPGSPARRAASIKVPVLLVHGDLDANVAIAHSEKMLAALKAEGKSVELIRFKGLDHQIDDSNARAEMLTRIGEFLDSSIGH